MKTKKGFTLFEMLVVISIIGILIATIATSFSSAQIRARDARRISDLNNMQKGMEQYFSSSNYVYPTTYSGTLNNTSGQFIMTFATDPKTGWTGYNFNGSFSNSSRYCFCATLESSSNSGNASSASAGASGCQFAAGGGNFYCVQNQQ